MTRTATGSTLALLDALEPEAKAAWEDELLNIQEAIQASRAITERRVADAAADLNTINVRSLPAETQAALPDVVRATYNPDFSTETP